jgi:ABC-2 type transport system permease protein
MPLLTKRGNSKLLDTATLIAHPTRARTPAAPFRDWLTMSGRSLRMSRRNIEGLMTSVALPVLLMLIFVYLFGGAINTGTAYVTYVVPGVLVLCAGFGSAMTAVSVCSDMTTGVIDRFRSMDVSGAAVVGGHVVASVVRNAVSTALVLGVALLIGFRPHADVVGWLAAAGILLLFILAISWLSAAVGLFAKSPEGASGFTFLLSFLPYPSSAFVPIRTMPIWLHGFASDQPVTPVIQSIRGYLLGQPVGTSPWFALAWTVGILLVSVALCAVIFQRRVG